MATPAENLEQLAERAQLALVEPQRMLLDAARAMLNEAGIGEARRRLDGARAAVHDGPALVKAAREKLVEQNERLRQATEDYERALIEAEWALDARFVTEGNKTFLITRYNGNRDSVPPDATLITGAEDDGVFETRKAMTADERAAWKRRTAADARELKPLRDALDRARHAVDLAKVDVDARENEWGAARYEADVARAQADLAAAQIACLARTIGGDR